MAVSSTQALERQNAATMHTLLTSYDAKHSLTAGRKPLMETFNGRQTDLVGAGG